MAGLLVRQSAGQIFKELVCLVAAVMLRTSAGPTSRCFAHVQARGGQHAQAVQVQAPTWAFPHAIIT